jgi:Arm domain-containing DNA-binding protein
MGLGAVRTTSLSEARELAAEARRKIRDGVDPIDERRAAKAAKKAEAAKRSRSSPAPTPISRRTTANGQSAACGAMAKTPVTASRARGRIEVVPHPKDHEGDLRQPRRRRRSRKRPSHSSARDCRRRPPLPRQPCALASPRLIIQRIVAGQFGGPSDLRSNNHRYFGSRCGSVGLILVRPARCHSEYLRRGMLANIQTRTLGPDRHCLAGFPLR